MGERTGGKLDELLDHYLGGIPFRTTDHLRDSLKQFFSSRGVKPIEGAAPEQSAAGILSVLLIPEQQGERIELLKKHRKRLIQFLLITWGILEMQTKCLIHSFSSFLC